MSRTFFADIIASMDMETLGKNIIRIRKLKGLSQRALAEKAGLSNRVIAYYEGQAHNDFLNKLERIANALEISIPDLLGHTSKSNRITSDEFDFSDFDTRTLRKIKELAKLSARQKSAIYEMIDSMVYRKEQENKELKS